MNSSCIATAVVIRDLNCYSIETINDRILLQKKIYLAQDIGIPLGYGYSWYIHGPYSTDLTAVVYQIIPEGVSAIENVTLKEPYKKLVEKVNNLEKTIEINHLAINTVQWYELLASIAYWYNYGIKSRDESIQKMQTSKPQFSKDQVKIGFDVYCNFIKKSEE